MDSISQYSCATCNKTYQRYSFFSRHLLTCNNPGISKNNCLPETIKYPSEIKQTLDYLIASNNELREKLKKMQSEKHIQTSKIDIIDWLNKNYKSDEDYTQYLETLTIDSKYLEKLQDNSIKIVLKEILETLFTRENSCFKAFTIKANRVYIFQKSNGWTQLTYLQIKTLISKISSEFIKLLNEWQNENTNRITQDNISNIYLKYLKKINSININNKSFTNNVYRMLYDSLKIYIEPVRYEFS